MEETLFKQLLEEVRSNPNMDIDTSNLSEEQLTELFDTKLEARAKKCVALQISLSAEAHYSGKEYYEEVIILSKDFLDKIYKKVSLVDDELSEDYTTITLYELDGKFSETEGAVSIEFLSEEDLQNAELSKYLECDWDGTELSNYIFDYNTELKEYCNNNLREYTKDIDETIEVKARIKRSQKAAFDKFIKSLKNNGN